MASDFRTGLSPWHEPRKNGGIEQEIVAEVNVLSSALQPFHGILHCHQYVCEDSSMSVSLLGSCRCRRMFVPDAIIVQSSA